MSIEPVRSDAIEPVVQALTDAFASDPLIGFLFGRSWLEQPHAGQFFRLLLRVRVDLNMPAYWVKEHDQAQAAVMGYDTTRPDWAPEYATGWRQLMQSLPGLELRLARYEQLANQYEPSTPHYYLGVIGVRAGQQDRGIGAMLLNHYCQLSERDPASSGVYLETASEASLRFYLKHGFQIRGEGSLDPETRLWCVFRPTC